MTQHEAQLYLAEQLPERIHHCPPYLRFTWRGTDNEIPEESWQQIALWVEEKMTDEQWELFNNAMYHTWQALKTRLSFARWRSQASYIARATAMKEANIKIL